MAYTSSYSGAEIDGAVGLLNGKGLGNVTGFVKRKADGSFEEGVPSEGSVTSVAVQNDTDGGLTVTGSPITSSGTIKLKHTNILSAASGNTAKLFPIKYDKNGHITGVGSEVTSLPASDVSAWAKAANKPSYTYDEVGAASSGHEHTLTIAADTGTSALDMAANTKYKLTAGGKTFIFKTPADSAPVTSVAGKTGAVTLEASDVGLGNVGNFKAVSTVANQGLTTTEQTNARTNIGAGTSSLTLGTTATTAAKGNHTHTASDVGAIATTAKGAANGVAELDSEGKVPSAQLPSYVDDVLEYATLSDFPATGESGKIYIAKDTNKTYRWGGTAYTEISASLALGETSSTAYYGDKGKTAYNHSQVTSGNPHNVTASDVGLGSVGNFKAVSTVASQGLTTTEQSNARANIGAGTSSLTIGTTSSTAAAGNHTHDYSDVYAAKAHDHDLSIATDSGTSELNMAASTVYKLTAGGKSFIFKSTPNTTYKFNSTYNSSTNKAATMADIAWANVQNAPTSLPASDVYDWAKAASKPSYTASEVGASASDHTHDITLATDTGTSTVTLASAGKYKLTAGGKSVVFTMPTIPTVNYPVTSVAGRTGAITLTKSDITDFPSSMTPSSHTHGNITNGGDITATAPTIASGDCIVINDDSASKVTNGPAFDGSTATKALTQKGTWETFGTSNLALGTTASTAYYGDKGKTAYDHSQSTHANVNATVVAASTTNGNIKIDGTETTVYTHPGSGTNPHGTTASDVGLGSVGNFKAVSTVASQGLTDTEKSNARANIGAGTSSLTIGTTSSTAAAGDHTHDYSSTYAAKSHAHGNITSAGDITATAPTIASGDCLVINDDSASKITNGPAFDGSTTTQALTKAGTWATFGTSNLTIGTTSTTAAAGDHTHSGYASSTHTHGNIQNGGTLQTNDITIASGDKLVVTDSSDSSKVARTSISFDGSTATKALTQKGTWETFGTSNLAIGTTASTAAAGNHDHTLNIAADTGTSALDMAADTKYKLTAGGKTFIFKTPAGGSGGSTITSWSAGSLPALTVTSKSIPNISVTSTTVLNSATVSGTTLTLGTTTVGSASAGTAISVGSASGWSTGSLPSLQYS